MILKQGLRSNKENDEKVISKLKNVSDLTWAYIAGWIDGDGCISTLKNKHGYNARRIGIKLIDREIIEWFADLFHTSVTKATEDRREDGYNHKTLYITGVSGVRARYICEQIRPYLIEKTKNAEKFLRSFEDYPIKTVPYMQHTDKEFMAWFTGYSEAEGSFRLKYLKKTVRNKVNSKGEHYKHIVASPEAVFELVNTNESIVRYCKTRLEKMGFFVQKVGFRKGRHTFFGAKGTKDRRVVKKKDLFRLFLAGSNAQILYRSMLPFMRCERKISTVEKSLAIVYKNKRRTKYGEKRTTCGSLYSVYEMK
tara:strand:- start:480 stop:1406 length:927 start_codon:yes stop_codon:yes gene_type:complete